MRRNEVAQGGAAGPHEEEDRHVGHRGHREEKD
jgi:hypothetical protein